METNYQLDALDAVRALTRGFDEVAELPDGTTRRGKLPALLELLAIDVAEATPVPGGARGYESKSPAHGPCLDALIAIKVESRALARLVGASQRGIADTLQGVPVAMSSRPTQEQKYVARRLQALVSQARLALGLDEPPILLRSIRCPYCGVKDSVVAARTEYRAWCTTRACVDPNGRRWSWQGETELHLLGASQDATSDGLAPEPTGFGSPRHSLEIGQ
jgi:hypothetical protein